MMGVVQEKIHGQSRREITDYKKEHRDNLD
jgi:hypothetical protein